jgi:hypothetical protein
MTLQTPVYVSTSPDDGQGDKLRDAFIKINERFQDIASLMQNRGNWTTGTQYQPRDYILQGGEAYVCVIGHTAGTFATDLAAGKWASVDALDLRADLASTTVGKGAALVAFEGGGNVQDLKEAQGSSLVGFKQAGTGAVERTAQDKMRESVSVKDFGAVGDGVTDDTAAIELAAQSLTGNQTLYFPDGTYLVSYIWSPYTDSDSVNGIGRGRGVCAFVNKPNIRLYGPKAVIKCVNHDIATNGGFAFAWVTKSPGFTVEGFTFDMTFTGYNTSASYYPLCGGIVSFDKYAGAGTQDTVCSRFTARDLTFKLYHPNGSFGITSAPFGGDNNNGFKILSVFASGDSAASAYSEQSRGLLMQNIRFLKGHNGYGCWGVAYNDATFQDIHADAWVAASYTIASGVYTGTNFVAPVRFYQYSCNGLTVNNVTVLSLPWAERTGAFQGRCGGVSVDCGLIDRFSGGGSVTNCTFILDDNDSALGSVFDVGIRSSLSGHVRVSGNSFGAWSNRGVVCVFALGEDGTGKADYTISENIVGKNISGPFLQVVNLNNTGDANRIIKSVAVTGNVVKGWGGEGAIYANRTGATYYGVEQMIVSNNIFDGTDSTTAASGTAVDVRGRTSADNIVITANIIKGAGTPVQVGSSSKTITDNVYLNNIGNGTFGNYLTNTYGTLATFAAAQSVSMTIPAGYYNEYQYTEYSSAGAIVTMLAGLASSTTGVIRTVGAGNTGKLFYKQIANIK